MSIPKSTARFFLLRMLIIVLLIGLFMPSSTVSAQTSGPHGKKLPPHGVRTPVSPTDIHNSETLSANLLQDPGFEFYTPNPYWGEYSYQFNTPLCTVGDCAPDAGTAGPHAGAVWAWFGGVPAPYYEAGYLYQTVTVPSSCKATLQFYYWISSAAPGSGADDYFVAAIDNSIVFSSNATQQGLYPSYTLISIDASAFADGGMHTIYFVSETTDQVNFNLDDVSLVTDNCTISGNAGVAGAVLQYTHNGPQTVTADGSGNYSITISNRNWSGAVTPYKTGYSFTPVSNSYGTIHANYANQNFTAGTCATCANTQVWIGAGAQPIASYTLQHSQNVLPKYGTAGGPVLVKSTNAVNIFTSQRAAYGASFNELMGYPANQLTTEYWFTYYDDVNMNTWLMIGNPDPANSAHVEVYIGSSNTPVGTYDIPHGQSVLPKYGIADGPVRVKSTNGVNIFTSQRAAYGNSFNELMGYPADKLTTEYWFTYYDDVNMNTWLMIGNPDPANSAHVEVYIGNSVTPIDTYDIPHGQSVLPKYHIAGGPVRVKSTNGVNIFTSQRAAYGRSFNELMGYPADQLTTDYWFTYLDDVNMNTWLMIGNPDPANSAHVEVYVGTNPTPIYTVDLAHGQSVLPKFHIADGPVRVKSTNGVNIFTSQRAAYGASFNELMGFPANQLTTDYWFTYYDDVNMNTWLLVGVPN